MQIDTVPKWFFGALAAAAAIGAPARPASAEEAISLDRFAPAPAGDRMFGVPSPFAVGSPGVHMMLLGDYAHNPLVVRRDSDGEKLGAIVSSQLFLHLNASLALWDRLNVNLDLPLAVAQSGEDPRPDSRTQFQSPSTAALGDVRLGLRFRISGEAFDSLQLAIGGYLWLPTGSDDDGSFVSDGSVRGAPQLILGGRTDRVVWSASLGTEIRPSKSFAGSSRGTLVTGGAGFGILLGDERQIQLGPELSILGNTEGLTGGAPNAELLLDGRYRFLRNFEAGIGIGPGLSRGLGTPDLRAVAMVAYTPEQKPPAPPSDRDKDTIFDEKDACPDAAGVADKDPKKNGCPPPPPDRDNDGILDEVDACVDVAGAANDDAKKNGCPPPKDLDKDGILDEVDACVDVAGAASDDAKKNGCPPDKDGDGVIDSKDACVEIAGLKTDDAATNGCPGDTDKDTIRDDKDACPKEPGKPDPNPKKNGCPTVRVGTQEVLILDQVEFDTNTTRIRKVSDPLLDKVAAVLKEHPDLTKVEVQGHTDDRGGEKHNDILSQGRASAVVAALVKRGVEKKRLTAKGYGQKAPVDTNDTDEGRQNNRRVQFKIVERAQPK